MSMLIKSAAAMLVAAALAHAPSLAQDADPFLWLEEIEGEEALDWVRANNARSQKALEAAPQFEAMKAEALEILTSDARLPVGQIRNGMVYNFWQDDEHKRGLWRRASVESYRKGAPKWETVLDYDKLAKDEDANWVAGARVCLSPEYRHCMIELSDGGKDAGIWREFDTRKKRFVKEGFALQEAKSYLEWFDKDLVLVATDIGEDSLTTSGYPRTVKSWERGQALDEAPIIFEIPEESVFAFPMVAHDGDRTHVILREAVTFYESQFTHAQGARTPRIFPLPPNADYHGVLDNRAVFLLREEWAYEDELYPQGSLIAYNLDTEVAELIASPTETQSFEDIGVGEASIVMSYLDDVVGKAARFTLADGAWARSDVAVPDNGVVSLVSSGGGTEDAIFSFESATVPDTLFYAPADGAPTEIFQAPEFYDASGVVVEQRFATSTDGEKIPYFLIANKATLEAGPAPTVQYGYGGFLAPILPVYYSDPGRPQHGALAGKMWISRGGVLVLSNIRGGSEYGPRWHEAALKENRQLAFDDFIAISEALIADGVTTPEKLGAIGRSNGGLLMGAIMTQRPDLYAAIDNGVPLFDMKRYNKLLAGASWMGEYGDPDKPEDWRYISAYSPYQKIDPEADYPKVFFYTSTKDDRVHPGHARKAAAKMDAQGHEFFYYENIEGGHGGTANQEQLAYRTALEYAYFALMLMNDGE